MEEYIPLVEKDPIDDKEEFVKRIKKIFCWKEDLYIDDILEHLVMKDEIKLEAIREKKAKCEKEIEKYIQKYDKAASREDRANVVGSVEKIQMG